MLFVAYHIHVSIEIMISGFSQNIQANAKQTSRFHALFVIQRIYKPFTFRIECSTVIYHFRCLDGKPFYVHLN